MTRAWGVLIIAGLVPATGARANDLQPYLWGVGIRLGTIIIPGSYPALFPDRIGNYDFVQEGPQAGDPTSTEPDRDLDPVTGLPLFTSIEKVRGDFRVGIDSFYGIDARNRIGLAIGGGFATRYTDLWFTFDYDRVLLGENAVDLVGGLQAGFGAMSFTGKDPDETLHVPYFPLRARLGAELLNNTQLYGLDLLVGTGIPSRHAYTDLTGAEQQVQSPFNFVNYFFLAIELSVEFGDLSPPA